MNLDKLNSALSLTANVGVIIGLLLVAYELRQNDDTLNTSIRLSLSSSYEEISTLMVENPALADSIKRLFLGEELTVDDNIFLSSWQSRFIQVLHTTYNLYREGIVTESFWREKASHFTVFMLQSERFTQLYFFNKHDEMYSPEFYAALEAIYAAQQTDHADRPAPR